MAAELKPNLVLFRNLMPMAVLMSFNVLARGQSIDRMRLFYSSNAVPSMHTLQHAQLIGRFHAAVPLQSPLMPLLNA